MKKIIKPMMLAALIGAMSITTVGCQKDDVQEPVNPGIEDTNDVDATDDYDEVDNNMDDESEDMVDDMEDESDDMDDQSDDVNEDTEEDSVED